jgi:hypothetical protein
VLLWFRRLRIPSAHAALLLLLLLLPLLLALNAPPCQPHVTHQQLVLCSFLAAAAHPALQ